jgi:hypothetical protein
VWLACEDGERRCDLTSFQRDGLGLRQEPNGMIADEAYLANGCTAEVCEVG